ncbi:hypothetical protein PoB_002198300 [Plakobranchus ocellatus]|uniref:Uncharacterized protein n=1 Tax=Plakobranchus ocellatus TaxID=259542 RepID=A0AAV3ZKU4_9GAST|nr:hypothetical protein PoB_002198300 [Plakobranchus ocellatus]
MEPQIHAKPNRHMACERGDQSERGLSCGPGMGSFSLTSPEPEKRTIITQTCQNSALLWSRSFKFDPARTPYYKVDATLSAFDPVSKSFDQIFSKARSSIPLVSRGSKAVTFVLIESSSEKVGLKLRNSLCSFRFVMKARSQKPPRALLHDPTEGGSGNLVAKKKSTRTLWS